jgi:hypothetical protein
LSDATVQGDLHSMEPEDGQGLRNCEYGEGNNMQRKRYISQWRLCFERNIKMISGRVVT